MNKLKEIAGVDNKIGRNSRTGSNITITVPDDLIMDVAQYYMSVRSNKEPTGNIKKIELVMYSEDDLKEDVELPDTKELDIVLIEEGEEITNLNYAFNNGWLSKEYYDKEIDKLRVTKVNASNQPDLDIYEDRKEFITLPVTPDNHCCETYEIFREKKPNGKVWCGSCGHVFSDSYAVPKNKPTPPPIREVSNT
jgi:hypothetical protein